MFLLIFVSIIKFAKLVWSICKYGWYPKHNGRDDYPITLSSIVSFPWIRLLLPGVSVNIWLKSGSYLVSGFGFAVMIIDY